jgi:hypothetical protein
MSDEFYIPPPNTMTVFHDHRPVLYTPDGKAIVRQAGFTAGGSMSQTAGTFPQLNKGGKKIGGRKGGKRGC